ncbi:hypothetical protein FQR65_LT13458 [Abscondita terminalis]|nr:hypothetical protein FQR65_LT13458 [Abscondita terminalis]
MAFTVRQFLNRKFPGRSVGWRREEENKYHCMDGSWRQEFVAFKEDIKNSLASRLVIIENRIMAIEKVQSETNSEINDLKSSLDTFNNTENIIEEFEERQSRKLNLLLFNLPESNSNSTQSRIDEDFTGIKNILDAREITSEPLKVVRIGNKVAGKTRPVKITFSKESEVFNILKSNRNDLNNKNHFRADRTKYQIDYFKKIKREFDDRKSKGETNIQIRDITPTVSTSPTIKNKFGRDITPTVSTSPTIKNKFGRDITPTVSTSPTIKNKFGRDITPTVSTSPTDTTPTVSTSPTIKNKFGRDITPTVSTSPTIKNKFGRDITPTVSTSPTDTTPTVSTSPTDTTPTVSTSPTDTTPTVSTSPTYTTPTQFLDGPYRRPAHNGHNADNVHIADGHYADSAHIADQRTMDTTLTTSTSPTIKNKFGRDITPTVSTSPTKAPGTQRRLCPHRRRTQRRQ